MEFHFKGEPVRDLSLEFFNDRIIELHDLVAGPAKKMVVMLFLPRGFIKGITARLKALFDHARLKQDRNIPVDRIAGHLQSLLSQPADEVIHVKMSFLTGDPSEKLLSFLGQTEPLGPDKLGKVILGVFHQYPYQD
jgi:hypothetical protein